MMPPFPSLTAVTINPNNRPMKKKPSVTLEDLDRYERIAVNTENRFAYDRDSGTWSWSHSDDKVVAGFDTRFDALMDAIKPYLPLAP